VSDGAEKTLNANLDAQAGTERSAVAGIHPWYASSMLRPLLIPLAVTLLVLAATAPVRAADDGMPKTGTVRDTPVQRRGCGIRRWFAFHVYELGLFVTEEMKRPASDDVDKEAERVLKATSTMTLRLAMRRELDTDTMRDAMLEGLRNAHGVERDNDLPKPLRDMVAAIIRTPLVEGDVFDFVFEDGRRITLHKYSGEKRDQTSRSMAYPSDAEPLFTLDAMHRRGILAIWLGDKPVDESLKPRLLGIRAGHCR